MRDKSLWPIKMCSVGETKPFQEPTIVKMSDGERDSGVMEIENVAKAVIALHRDGFVVLENVVDPEHCESLDKLMCDEADRMKTDPKTIWNDVSLKSTRLLGVMLRMREGSPCPQGEALWKYATCTTSPARADV